MLKENNIFISESIATTRPAKRSEVETLYNLVRELAQHEGENTATLPLTKENLQRFGFGDNPIFHTEFVEYEESVVGYALYFYTFAANQGLPILYLEDLYVQPHYRDLGLGKLLLRKLARYAIQKNCCRLEWHVYSWNTQAAKFYQNLGGTFRKDLIQTRLEKADLHKLVH